jgi:rhodanese-related sulfurtransferase
VSISKFVPGLALLTPPLMGTTAVDARIYAAWDIAGATAWATFWLLGGAAAEKQLHMLLAFVGARGGTVADILLAAALVYLAFRLQQQRRARRRLALAAPDADPAAAPPGWRRIAPPMILDARPEALTHEAASCIPGALALDPHSPEQIDGALLAYDTVIYCICADNATAVDITERMRRNGYTRIRALRGGLDAWQRRGFPIEPLSPVDELTTGKRTARPPGDMHDAVTLRGLAPRRSESV